MHLTKYQNHLSKIFKNGFQFHALNGVILIMKVTLKKSTDIRYRWSVGQYLLLCKVCLRWWRIKKGELHNTLEPAAHAIPVIIGRYFSRFEEAVVLEKKEGFQL